MILLILAFVGGILTIVSPCTLPVLPFVFATADRSFLRHGLPMLASMALTFAAMASLAAIAGLVFVAIELALSIVLMTLLGKWLKLPPKLTSLLALGARCFQSLRVPAHWA